MNNSHWDHNEPEQANDRHFIIGVVICWITAFFAPFIFLLSIASAFRIGGIGIILGTVFLIAIFCGGAFQLWKSDRLLTTKWAYLLLSVIPFILGIVLPYLFISNSSVY